MSAVRRLTQDDLPRLRQFWIEHWGSDEEAEERRTKRFAEFKAAADVFFALSA